MLATVTAIPGVAGSAPSYKMPMNSAWEVPYDIYNLATESLPQKISSTSKCRLGNHKYFPSTKRREGSGSAISGDLGLGADTRFDTAYQLPPLSPGSISGCLRSKPQAFCCFQKTLAAINPLMAPKIGYNTALIVRKKNADAAVAQNPPDWKGRSP